MARLTGCLGWSRVIRLPWLTAAGTSTLPGTITAISCRIAVTTSAALRPTLASERLRHTMRASAGLPSRSSVSRVTRRFFSAGMSSVAMSTMESLRSKAASTWSVMAGGVSTTMNS